MKRDVPEDLLAGARQHDEQPRSLLASRAFWVGGGLSVAVWAAILVLAFNR